MNIEVLNRIVNINNHDLSPDFLFYWNRMDLNIYGSWSNYYFWMFQQEATKLQQLTKPGIYSSIIPTKDGQECN